MGILDPAKGKRIIKELGVNSHNYVGPTYKILHDKKEHVINYFCRVSAGYHLKFVYFDFSILFTRILHGMKYLNVVNGDIFVRKLFKHISTYNDLKPKAIIIANEGDTKKRPYLKEKRPIKDRVTINPADLIIDDKEMNLNSKIWRDNNGNMEIRSIVYEYVRKKLNQRWRKNFKYTSLICDNFIIEHNYTATEVKNKKISEINSADACEGEQTIYAWLKHFIKKYPVSLHIVDGGSDTDHYTYCMLHQNDFKRARVFLRMIHYKTIIDDEEVFANAKSYIVDVYSLIDELKAYFDKLRKNCKFDVIKLFAVLWGMVIGNDFVWSFNKEKEADPQRPKRKYYLRSFIRGINAIKLIESACALNAKYYDIQMVNNKPKHVLILNDFIDLFSNLSKKDFTQEHIDHLSEIVRRTEWCLNYFMNPADKDFFDPPKGRKRIKKSKKRLKQIKLC